MLEARMVTDATDTDRPESAGNLRPTSILDTHAEGGQYYLGSPAVPIGQASRQYAVIANLPELSKRVRELERQIERLKDED